MGIGKVMRFLSYCHCGLSAILPRMLLGNHQKDSRQAGMTGMHHIWVFLSKERWVSHARWRCAVCLRVLVSGHCQRRSLCLLPPELSDTCKKEGMALHGPQYSGLFLVMIGMLIQWPTIITALMFPVLIFVYYRLSKREEREMITLFGDEYRRYAEKTPMFIPKLVDRAK